MEVSDFRDGQISEVSHAKSGLLSLNEYAYKELFSCLNEKDILNLRVVSKGVKTIVDVYLLNSRQEITINSKQHSQQVAVICNLFANVSTLRLKGFHNLPSNRRKSRYFAFIFSGKLPNLRSVYIEFCDCEDLHFMIKGLFTNPLLEKLHIAHSKLNKEAYNSIDPQLVHFSLVAPQTSYLKLFSSTSFLTNAVNLESLEITVTKQEEVYKGFPFRDLMLRSKKLKKLKFALYIPASDVRFLKQAKIENFTLSSPNPRLIKKKVPDQNPLHVQMQQWNLGNGGDDDGWEQHNWAAF